MADLEAQTTQLIRIKAEAVALEPLGVMQTRMCKLAMAVLAQHQVLQEPL